MATSIKYIKKKNQANIAWERKVTDLPTNKLFGLAGADANWVSLKTRMTADDDMFVSNVREMQKLDENGRMVPMFSQSEASLKLFVRCIADWSLREYKDEQDEIGTKLEINEENVGALDREDFEHLMKHFQVIMGVATEAQLFGAEGESETDPAALPAVGAEVVDLDEVRASRDKEAERGILEPKALITVEEKN